MNLDISRLLDAIEHLSLGSLATSEFGMTRICEISGLYERMEKQSVELWREDRCGQFFIRLYAEGGNRYADVEVAGLLTALGQISSGAHTS